MRLLAIAGSTGAPAVIADILAAIASELDVPVLVVQHISPGFAAGFASWLAGRSGLPAALAEHGQRAQAGHVYVAPDDRHLGVDRTGRIVLSDDQPEDGFRPSATYLFRSVANAYGRSALGVLLSGMGRDGAGGLSELHRLGGTTIAQDEASCVVFGMPREAIRLGAATLVLPPVEIAGAIVASSHAEQEDRRERAVDRD